jgi:hypothetical protein
MTMSSIRLPSAHIAHPRRWVAAPTPAALFAVLGGCLLLGVSLVILPWAQVCAVIAVSVILIVVMLHPQVAAYLLLAITPLVAGIDRGAGIPFLRPTEALAALVGAGLLGRGVLVALHEGVPPFRPSTTDVAIGALLATGSILPFLWMLARGVQVTGDDVLYGLVLWKFFAIYLIFRFSIRTEPQVRTCLWIVMITGSLVAIIAMLQALGVPPVTAFVSRYYSQYGDSTSALNGRGGATFGLPIALADFMLFDLAIAAGFLLTARRRRPAVYIMAGLFVGGVFASAEFSALIGLLVAVVALAIFARRRTIVLYILPALFLAVFVLRPVIEQRLLGFQSVSGLPVSWTGRIHNLTSYFWPQLFSGDQFVLGVRLSARVVVPSQATGYVWIESGYTWLLWSGGIPFLLAFIWFTSVGIRHGVATARARADAIGIAGLAAATGLSVVAVLMLFDPHLTYRGAADLLFALLALMAVRGVGAEKRTPSAMGSRSLRSGAVESPV